MLGNLAKQESEQVMTSETHLFLIEHDPIFQRALGFYDAIIPNSEEDLKAARDRAYRYTATGNYTSEVPWAASVNEYVLQPNGDYKLVNIWRARKTAEEALEARQKLETQ